jgi:uncharacterized phiE125 gp8 family phage protein
MPEPVTLAEIRAHLRLDTTGGTHPDDGYLQALIAAARGHVENASGLVLVQATKDQAFDYFPIGDIDGFRLPYNPVASVTWVKYVAEGGTLTTLASTVYRLDSTSLRARLALEDGQVWPTARDVVNAIQIRTVCGGTVEAPLKHAILLLAAHWYENRTPVAAGSLADMPHMVDALLAPYRIWSHA